MKNLFTIILFAVASLLLPSATAWIDPGYHEGYTAATAAPPLSFEEEMRQLKQAHRQENIEAAARRPQENQSLMQDWEMRDLRKESVALALAAAETPTAEAAVPDDSSCEGH